MLRFARAVQRGAARGRSSAIAAAAQRSIHRGMTTAVLCEPRRTVTTPATTDTIKPQRANAIQSRAMHSAAAQPAQTQQPATAAAAPSALPTQQQRWENVRALATRLLDDTEPTAESQTSAAAEWIVWPSLRAQAGANAALHAAAKAAEAEAGEAFTIDEQRELQSEGADAEEAAAAVLSSRPTLTSSQSLAPSLHSAPHLVMPQVARMWRRLAQLDRAALRRADERSKGTVIDVAAPLGTEDDDASSSSAPVWSSRGLFLDGPLGIGKSSALYALTCLARASGWMAVHISDADAWVGQLGAQDGSGANRMLVQAIYEAAANCVLPSTALWSSPHSLLQLPLTPSLEYTSILEDQGITSFGELLVLALGLEDGSEEAELAVECIWAQLQSMDCAGVPVIICVDGFDALTQRCFRPAAADVDVDAEEALADSALIAPITTSPFSWLNYHRSRAFRGGFVLSGESFALVSQSHPELMEQAPSRFEDEQTNVGAEGDEFGFGGMKDSASETEQKKAATNSHHVDPIHVVSLPPLSSAALCRSYILDRAARSADSSLAALFSRIPPAHSLWSFLFHRLTSGHFGLMDSMLGLQMLRQHQPAATATTEMPSERALWDAFVEARTSQTLQRFSSLFPSDAAADSSSAASSSLQRSLAGFFLAHLPSGFYRDFLRNAGRASGGGRIGRDNSSSPEATVARDYNLIALNEVESVAQIQWIQSTLLRDQSNSAKSSSSDWTSASASAAASPSSFVTDSSAWGMLTADLPWDALSKDQLLLVRASKSEALHQLLAMGIILQSKGGSVQLTPLAQRVKRPQDALAAISLPLRSLNHWSPSSDPSILSVADLSPQSLQLHWSLPDSIVDASSRAGIEATPGSMAATGAVEHLARVVHVDRVVTKDGETASAAATASTTTLTLFLPILDPKHLALMMNSSSVSSAPSPSSAHQLIHTLHLHQLSEVLQSFQVLVGPALSVVAVTADGCRVTWAELEAMIDAMQAGQAEGSPLMQATIVGIEAQPLTNEGDAASTAPSAPSNADAAARPKLRLVIVSPHSGSQPAVATAAADSAASASASSSVATTAASPRQFHALFDFASAILGSDLAALLTIPTAELGQIRWK